MLIDQLGSGFEEPLKTVDNVNDKKEARLRYAHFLLVLAAVSATVAAITQLIVHGT